MAEKNKLKLLYILEIMQHTDADHPLNISQIIRNLQSKGINAERKSIARDLHTISEAGFSIVKCESHNDGFYMTDQLFEDYELKILADAIFFATWLTEKDSDKLIQKLKSIATENGKQLISSTTYIDSSLKSEDSTNKIKFDTVLHAIMHRHQISFQYMTVGPDGKKEPYRNGKIYTASPYYLPLYENEYYLIANPSEHEHATHFKLDLMEKIAEIPYPVRPISEIYEFKNQGSSFSITRYLKESVHLYNGTSEVLTLHCSKWVRRNIQKKFGKNTVMINQPNGSFLVHVRVAPSEGFYQWLAGYGCNIVIKEPENVKNEFLEFIDSIEKAYGRKENEHESE